MPNGQSDSKFLSMEQQFSLRKFQEQLRTVPREELEDLFLEVMRQKMAQENLFRGITRQS